MQLRMLAFVSSFVAVLLLGELAMAAQPVRKSPVPEGPRVASTVSIPVVENGHVLRTETSGDYRVVIDETAAKLSLTMEKEESTRSQGVYLIGDTVRIARATKLQAKGTTPVALSRGEILGVRSVDPQYGDTKWVGVHILDRGETRQGWVAAADVELVCAEPQLESGISSLAAKDFGSAGLLIQKAKIFDDGLMATAQLAAQNGAGKLHGKAAWLPQLIATSLDEAPEAARPLLAAAKLGQLQVEIPANELGRVNALIQEFRADERESKPIGFYTWSNDLTTLFQQDRMLQSKLEQKSLVPLVKAMQEQQGLRADYEAYVSLIARLTNPPVGSDLRTMLAGKQVNENEIPLISASQAPETNLVRKLFGAQPVPDGFDLATELVKRIKGGLLSLQPAENSGWYDHQLWSLEPLITPEKTAEGAKWTGNDEYRKHLEAVFKGAWALTRETHIKDLDFPEAAAAPAGDGPVKIEISVRPRLTSEPLATSYRRRADSYRFVRQVLLDVFGEEGLTAMHRQTALGPVKRSLLEELSEIENIFDGAAVMVERELGLVSAKAEDESIRTNQAQVFLDFVANASLDADIAADVRMMVPVFFDLQRKQSKVWVFLGWTTRSLYYDYELNPSVVVLDSARNKIAQERLDLSFYGSHERVLMPVFREVYVSKLLNRDEFRRLCDAYATPRAILEHLK